MKHSEKLKHASLSNHGNCAFMDRLDWPARCRVCDKLALVPNHVVLGSMAIGFVIGGFVVIIVGTLWGWS